MCTTFCNFCFTCPHLYELLGAKPSDFFLDKLILKTVSDLVEDISSNGRQDPSEDAKTGRRVILAGHQIPFVRVCALPDLACSTQQGKPVYRGRRLSPLFPTMCNMPMSRPI